MTIQNSMQAPPDQGERLKAIDTSASVIVEAPAGSGKNYALPWRKASISVSEKNGNHIAERAHRRDIEISISIKIAGCDSPINRIEILSSEC